MAIYRLLQRSAFAPEDIAPMIAAYEACVQTLKLSDQPDSVKETVAKHIIEIAQTGLRDPVRIRELALERSGLPPAP
jgi:hypothetical protein